MENETKEITNKETTRKEPRAEKKTDKKTEEKIEQPTTDNKSKAKKKSIQISLREFCNSLGNIGINKFAFQTLSQYEGQLKTREEWEALHLGL